MSARWFLEIYVSLIMLTIISTTIIDHDLLITKIIIIILMKFTPVVKIGENSMNLAIRVVAAANWWDRQANESAAALAGTTQWGRKRCLYYQINKKSDHISFSWQLLQNSYFVNEITVLGYVVATWWNTMCVAVHWKPGYMTFAQTRKSIISWAIRQPVWLPPPQVFNELAP